VARLTLDTLAKQVRPGVTTRGAPIVLTATAA
jgi:hypothetical protein